MKNAIQLVADSKTYTFTTFSPEEKYEWNNMISIALAAQAEKSPNGIYYFNFVCFLYLYFLL